MPGERVRERLTHTSPVTHPLSEILDLGLLERKALHLLVELAHLALLDLDPLDVDALVGPAGLHALFLGRAEDTQTLALALVTRGTADTVNVRVDVVGAVELDDPVDSGEVETTGGNIGTDQKRRVGARELLEDAHTRRLLLLAVQVHEGETRVETTESLKDEAHLLATGDKHDTLHLQVALDETPQSVQLAVQRDHGVKLLEVAGHDTFLSGLVAVDVQGVVERQLGKAGEVVGLGGREEQRLAVGTRSLGRRKVLDNGTQSGKETQVKETVRLVKHEHLDTHTVKANSRVEVLQETTGGSNENVHAAKTVALLLERLATNDKTSREGVEATNVTQRVESLHSQLTSGRDDNSTKAVHRAPLLEVQALQHGNEEGERLARTGTRRAENVLSTESGGDRQSLDRGGVEEVAVLEAWTLATTTKRLANSPLRVRLDSGSCENRVSSLGASWYCKLCLLRCI